MGFSRRRLIGTAAAVAVTGSMAPAVIRAQDAPVEVTFHHIWGTPQGEQAPAKPHGAVQLIDAFNAKNLGVKVIG